MIRRLLNLTCTDGHRWYAPQPDAWIGKECQHNKCLEPLRALIRPSGSAFSGTPPTGGSTNVPPPETDTLAPRIAPLRAGGQDYSGSAMSIAIDCTSSI